MGSAKSRRGHCAKSEAIEVLAACEEAEHEGGEWKIHGEALDSSVQTLHPNPIAQSILVAGWGQKCGI